MAPPQKEHGRWVGRADTQPVISTATAGLALLMEGSTLKEGTYAPNLRKAVEWLGKQVNANGLVAGEDRVEVARPIPAHAKAMLFLACAYDVADDPKRQARLKAILELGVAAAAEAQTEQGGWALTARNGRGDTTVTLDVLHALFTAQKVGVEVPRKVTEKAAGFLAENTGSSGALLRPGLRDDGFARRIDAVTLTSAAAATYLTSGAARPGSLGAWVKYLRPSAIQPWPNQVNTQMLQLSFQVARAAYALGEGGHRLRDPRGNESDVLKWSRYRSAVFKSIAAAQSADGSWGEPITGPVSGTALALIVLQLENDYVAAFAR